MSETMPSVFLERVARYGDRPALRTLVAGGSAREDVVSWKEWGKASRAFAAALIESGHRTGEAVGIFAGNRVVWPVADLGILMAGGVSVGIYPTSAPGQVSRLLANAAAVALVVDSRDRAAMASELRPSLPALRSVIADGAPGAGALSWDEWISRGERALRRAELARELDLRIARARSEDVALLIYTSGSTGEPKGAEISHRYLLDSALSIREALGLRETDSALSFLPFCHAAERVFGLHTRIVCGMEAGLVEDHARLWDAAAAYGPTLFGGLPRFFEKACDALRAEMKAAPQTLRERWERTLELGRIRSRAIRAGTGLDPALEAEWLRIGEPVLRAARERFGGRIRLATSGGASLPPEIAEWLDAVGITVLGAYGLTEHLCVAFNRPERYGFDSAGPPMPGTEIRIARDGEVLVRRGPLTFGGYRGLPAATREAFTPGGEWLHTGDLGSFADDGCLRVTGRKKELIALSSGKKVAPVPIESLLVEDAWVGQAMLYGEGRHFVSALLTLRRPAVETWASERGLDLSFDALLRHPDVLSRVQLAVDRINASLSRPEWIRRWVILERELTLEEDELTATMKLRRPFIAEKFRDRLDALYS